MPIYLNNSVKFNPNLIWNDGALGFFEDGLPNKNKMSCDMGSVPDPQNEQIHKFINSN